MVERSLPLGYELCDFGMARTCNPHVSSQFFEKGQLDVPAKTLIEEPPSILTGHPKSVYVSMSSSEFDADEKARKKNSSYARGKTTGGDPRNRPCRWVVKKSKRAWG